MMFSTKAEYGVRVMVELGRGTGGDPIPLAEIAARGGYMLARSPAEITMAEVVSALEGSIAPIECISEAPDGTIVCARESEPGHVCPTKLLWTKVRLAIVRTLQETTLADVILDPAAGDAVLNDGAPLAWLDAHLETLTPAATSI